MLLWVTQLARAEGMPGKDARLSSAGWTFTGAPSLWGKDATAGGGVTGVRRPGQVPELTQFEYVESKGGGHDGVA
jgi:hypothetical protein